MIQKENTMKNFCKKGISLVLAVLLLCALLPVTASAAQSGACGDGVKWSFSDGVLSIKGSGSMSGYSEANMPPWTDLADSILQVKVASGVTQIGSMAFYNCANLQSVSLPDTLQSIGSYAFKSCTALTALTLPSALQSIGNSAFENCEKLRSIRLPNGLRSIGDFAFYRCSSLQTVLVPSSVVSFGVVVFAYCSSLLSAVIKAPLTKLPDWTFYNCTALQNVVLADTIASAGNYAFHDCRSVSTIYYAGDHTDQLLDSIRQDGSALNGTTTIRRDEYSGTTTVDKGELDYGASKNESHVTEVKNTENSEITKKTDTEITVKKDGKDSSLNEVIESGSDENTTIEVIEKTEIDATVDNSEGWTELADAVPDPPEDKDVSASTEVKVKISGGTVSGDDLRKLGEKDATVEISTENGSRWRLRSNELTKENVKKKTYDLDYGIEKEENGKSGIDSQEVYKLSLKDTLKGKSVIAVNVSAKNAGSYATLFEKRLFGVKELETVLIDNNGDAWFSTEALSSNKTYYIGINVTGVDKGNATVPHTMAAQYNLVSDSDYTLTDADGNYYAVGERESSWGITKKQFTLYALLGLGAVVLAVTVAMVTINTVKKSKRKVAAEHGEALPSEETEEEMRIRIMKEMLDESKKNKS